MTIDDNHTDFSLAQKDTLLHHVPEMSKSEISTITKTLKKKQPERVPLSETTTALMRAIRKVHVERLAEYFEQTCDRRPHDIAVICGSFPLTYQELDRRANRLAHLLISRSVKTGNPVGLLLERSLDTYIALLGILKAGAIFVPLDSAFSSESITFIAQDAKLLHLVTTSEFRNKINIPSCSILEIDQEYEALSREYDTRPQVYIDPASPCYVIYKFSPVSQPEGVAFSHTNIVNFLRAITPIYRTTHSDRVYQGMSIASDHAFEEIWPAWIAGAALVANPAIDNPSGHELTEFLIKCRITMLCCSPTQLATIERDVPSLRALFMNSEVCPPYLVSRWTRPGRRMLNTYGCTETTIAATWCELFPSRPITIGIPLPTYHVYILDQQFRPVRDGETGQLFIGGPGVAMGYLNRSDIANERFILNPILHDREIMPRLYRTGDLGRITPAGEIEYLGQINPYISHSYRSTYTQVQQAVSPQVTPLPAFEPQTSSEREVKTSGQSILKRINIKKIYQQIMTDPLYKNSIFNMASTFMLGGLGFFFWIIIARLYKTEYVGIATTLISIMTLLSSLSTLGQNVSLNRYLPKSPNKNELINSAFVLVTIVTISASVIFLIGLQIFSPQLLFLRSNLFYIISFVVFVIFTSWNTLIDSTSMAFRAASNILIKNTIISVSKLLLPFVLVTLGAYGIFGSTAVAIAAGVLVGMITLINRYKIKPSISVNFTLIKETSVYSFANYITNFMFNMPSLVLPIIILNVLSAKYAAYYYVASMIQSILQIIPAAAAQSLLTEGSYNEAALKKHIKKSVRTVSIILVPAIVVICIAGNILLQSFGEKYADEAFHFLQLYSISTILIALMLISNAIMNVKHQIKALVSLNIFASILILGLSYAFISGKLVGIGLGWILGQAITGGICLFFIIRNYTGIIPTPM